MLDSRKSGWDRIEQAFAEQFEQDGSNLVYRRSQKGVAIRVSGDERRRFIEKFSQDVRRAKWIIYGGLTLVLGSFIAIVLVTRSSPSQMFIFAAIGISMIPYFIYYRRSWAAPARELVGRTPIGRERSPDEVRYLQFGRLKYSQLATVAFGGAMLPFFVSSDQDVFSGWNRLWLVSGGALIVLAAIQAFRKWRYEQEDSQRNSTRRAPNLNITVPVSEATLPTKNPFWRYVPFAGVLLALAFIAYTPAGKQIAKQSSFWPIVMVCVGIWSLISVARGMRKGQIEPFARGFYNTYQRDTEPKRFWASIAWNSFLGCSILGLAGSMIWVGPMQALRDQCYDENSSHLAQQQLSACNQLIAKHSGSQDLATALASRGTAYFRLKNYARAHDDYTEAVRLDPKDAASYYNLGLVDEQNGKPARAIDDYTAAIRVRTDDADTYANRGRVLMESGRFAEAVTDFSRAYELKPSDFSSIANRGMGYALLGDRERAEKDFKTVRKSDPSNSTLVQNEVLLSYKTGDLRGAVDKLTTLLKGDPNNVMALRMRADLYSRLGDEEKYYDDKDTLWRLSKMPSNAGRAS